MDEAVSPTRGDRNDHGDVGGAGAARPSVPLVSVVIPAFQAERFISDAIESVLAQTYPAVECVVVDDGSTDGTAAAVEAYGDGVTLIRQANRGVAAARNTGIDKSAGQLIALLDADDVWSPRKLAAQVAAWQRRPETGLVLCGYRMVRADGRATGVVRPTDPARLIRSWLALEGNGPLLPSTGLIPRAVLEENGGFDERLSTSVDLHMAWTIMARHPVVGLPDVLVHYRIHPGQMHRSVPLLERDVRLLYDMVLTDGREGERFRRRCLANLEIHLALARLRMGDTRPAMDALRQGLRIGPDRVVGLPVAVLRRRLGRRLAAWRDPDRGLRP